MENKEIAYYKISKMELVAGTYLRGNNIEISRVGAYTADGRWVKWVSMNTFIDILKDVKIEHSNEQPKRQSN
jgi:hypothetical protein